MVPVPEHEQFLVPAEEIARRVSAFQSRLREQDIAWAWIDHLTDRYYLSGSAQAGVVLVPAEGDAVFLVRQSVERARAESALAVEPHPGWRGLLGDIGTRVGDGRLGLPLDVARASIYARLSDSLRHRPADLSAGLRLQRATKSPWELEQIRRAVEQYTRAVSEIAPGMRPGMTELELTGAIEGRMRELGHGGTIRLRGPGADIAMSTVVSGGSSLVPTAFDGCVGAPGPTPPTASGGGFKKLAAGETVMLDIVTSHNGYHGDTARTFFLGRQPPAEAAAAHRFCREVLTELETRVRPGARCSRIFQEVQAWVAERSEPAGFMGHGENRVRFFGHGVGLELDEMPVLAGKVDVELQPGMVLAIEPKAFLEGVGPVGIENTYVVTAGGCESTCPLPDGIVPV